LSGNLKGRDNITGIGVGVGDNNKMDLNYIGCEGKDWIQLHHDRVQWSSLVKADNKLPHSIQRTELLDHLSNYQQGLYEGIYYVSLWHAQTN
jgi:hypothetical protein